MLTTDEEIGGFDGVNFLLNKKGYRCKVAFVPDGGDNWQVCTDEKAISHIAIKAKGKSAHGSRPWQGVNANEELIEVFKTIQTRFFDKWGKPTNDDNWKPTLNMGKFKGGEATNSVSDYAVMHLDIRFPASIKRSEIIEIIKESTDENSNIEWEEKIRGESMHTDKANPYLKKWVSILKNSREVDFNEENGFSRGHAASDGRFFSALDIPVVMSKPTCSAPHIDNEWINIQSLNKFRNLLKKWILKSL
jgi:succinyl-diaminopimelate desuccinylase